MIFYRGMTMRKKTVFPEAPVDGALKIGPLFLERGFRVCCLNGRTNYVRGDTFFRVGYVPCSGIVLERAEYFANALRNQYEMDEYPLHPAVTEDVKRDLDALGFLKGSGPSPSGQKESAGTAERLPEPETVDGARLRPFAAVWECRDKQGALAKRPEDLGAAFEILAPAGVPGSSEKPGKVYSGEELAEIYGRIDAMLMRFGTLKKWSINDRTHYAREGSGTFYRIGFVYSLGFIIEGAEDFQEAIRDLHEDGDVFSLSIGRDLAEVMEQDIRQYYDFADVDAEAGSACPEDGVVLLYRRLDEMFMELGIFRKITVNDRTNYVFQDRYFRIDYMREWGFALQYTDGAESAKRNRYETGGIYPAALGEKVVAGMKKELLKKHIRVR